MTAGSGGAIDITWLFFVEPLGSGRSRFISRYRVSYSQAGLGTRLKFGPGLIEPIGFVMDRRMLLGVKERAEGRALPQSSTLPDLGAARN